MADNLKIEGAEDLISNLPDDILQHILCFIPIEVAIRTSLLSRRWRHVWCQVPSLSFHVNTLMMTVDSVNQTLARYTAPKTKSFDLTINHINIPYIDTWIKFAMSHNVENLSLNFLRYYDDKYKLPDFLYCSSSFKQLNITLRCYNHTIVPPQCTVSWTSLHKLSLINCSLSDVSLAKILSGCPVLEYLKLYHIGELNVLDLSRSPRLRTLEVIRNMRVRGPKHIVAPHIHSLRLYDPQLSCTNLVDVSSLTEAMLEISCMSLNSDSNVKFLQVVVLQMLDNLKNAEKLKLGRNFIQIASLAEIRGVPFPMLKVKALTLDTNICQCVIPGIERLLKNSPDLEKLTVGGRARFRIPMKLFDKYLKLQGFDVNKCWRSKYGASWKEHCVDAKLEHVASVVELVFKNCTEKLDKMVVLLDEGCLKFDTEDLTATLSHNNNVTIVLISSTNKPMRRNSEDW